MTTTANDLQEIQKIIAPLLGEKAWGVALGVGSFVTMEFGQPVPPQKPGDKQHGEWHLWIYCCAWRLEAENAVLAASEDDRTKLETVLKRLENLELLAIDLSLPGLDTLVTFDQEVVLRLFPIFSEEFEHWLLYTPDGRVLTIGPGMNWSYEGAAKVPE